MTNAGLHRKRALVCPAREAAVRLVGDDERGGAPRLLHHRAVHVRHARLRKGDNRHSGPKVGHIKHTEEPAADTKLRHRQYEAGIFLS